MHSRFLWYPTHYFITKSQQADGHRISLYFAFLHEYLIGVPIEKSEQASGLNRGHKFG